MYRVMEWILGILFGVIGVSILMGILETILLAIIL
jgi:hypothetical protein